jgi:hypothetical protein
MLLHVMSLQSDSSAQHTVSDHGRHEEKVPGFQE